MRRAVLYWGLALALSAPSVSAQTSCQSRLVEAQGLYVRGAFAEVEGVLEPCLQPGRLDDAGRVRAYRLLALAALQQGRLIEAKLAALSLLNLQPDYTPDLALDPPSYADLVSTVRSQLAVQQRRVEVDTSRVSHRPILSEKTSDSGGRGARWDETAVPERSRVLPSEAPRRRRRAGRVEVGLSGGFVSFAGDINRNDVFDDYFISDGPRVGLHLAMVPASWLVLGMGVEGAYYHKFPVQRRTPEQPPVRAEAGIVTTTLDARLRAWSQSLVSPYLSVGGSLAVAQLEGEIRLAGGPSGALGLDVAVTRGVSLFAEATVFYPIPDDAFDDSARRYGDLFSGTRGGFRWHVGR